MSDQNKSGYMLFLSEPTLFSNLRIIPAITPLAVQFLPATAEEWFQVYQCYDTMEAAGIAVSEDLAEQRQAVADGNLTEISEPDVVRLVTITADGEIHVHDGDEWVVLMPFDVFKEKGLPVPMPPMGQGDE